MSHRSNVKSLKPAKWGWVELMAAGVNLTGSQTAQAINEIYEEPVYVKATLMDSCADRCTASGLQALIPTVNLQAEAEGSTVKRLNRGPPKNRLKEAAHQEHPQGLSCWRFTGHIQQELAIRLQLSTIPGSYTSVASELHMWQGYMELFHPHEAQSP